MAKVIIERKELYTQAVASAKAEGASSKVRRLERGLKVTKYFFCSIILPLTYILFQ